MLHDKVKTINSTYQRSVTASTVNRGSDVIYLEGCGEITDALTDCLSPGKWEREKSQKGKRKEEGMLHIFGACASLPSESTSNKRFGPHSLTHCNRCA